MNRMPVAAIMYDFDRTLCTKDMQDYSFIPRLNMTEDEFWKFSNELGQSEHMDSILAYMYAMVKMSRERNMPLLRNDLVEMGKNVEFFDGVKVRKSAKTLKAFLHVNFFTMKTAMPYGLKPM